MHSGAKGKSGSKAPIDKSVPSWVEIKPAEVVELILDLNNQGKNRAQIGTILRDQYGVPSVKELTGKKVSQILEEHNVLSDVPRDLLNLINKSVKLYKHLAGFKKDYTAKRGYILTVSKIRRLADYYKKAGKLSNDWIYTPEAAALLVK